MQLTLCREVRYDTWFKPMIIKLLKKLEEVKFGIWINELIVKMYEGKFGRAAIN